MSCPRPNALEVGLAAVGEKPLPRSVIHFSGFFKVDRQLELVHSSPSSAMARVAGTVPSSPAMASRQASSRDMEPSEGRGPGWRNGSGRGPPWRCTTKSGGGRGMPWLEEGQLLAGRGGKVPVPGPHLRRGLVGVGLRSIGVARPTGGAYPLLTGPVGHVRRLAAQHQVGGPARTTGGHTG